MKSNKAMVTLLIGMVSAFASGCKTNSATPAAVTKASASTSPVSQGTSFFGGDTPSGNPPPASNPSSPCQLTANGNASSVTVEDGESIRFDWNCPGLRQVEFIQDMQVDRSLATNSTDADNITAQQAITSTCGRPLDPVVKSLIPTWQSESVNRKYGRGAGALWSQASGFDFSMAGICNIMMRHTIYVKGINSSTGQVVNSNSVVVISKPNPLHSDVYGHGLSIKGEIMPVNGKLNQTINYSFLVRLARDKCVDGVNWISGYPFCPSARALYPNFSFLPQPNGFNMAITPIPTDEFITTVQEPDGPPSVISVNGDYLTQPYSYRATAPGAYVVKMLVNGSTAPNDNNYRKPIQLKIDFVFLVDTPTTPTISQ